MINIRPGRTNDEGHLVLEKVFNAITLRTEDGEELHICMRDSGFEFSYNDVNYCAKSGIVETMNHNIKRSKNNES